MQDKTKLSDIEYIKSIIDDINKGNKSKNKFRDFEKLIKVINNKELIKISDYLSKLIEQTDSDDSLEKLLDLTLENITGT